MTVPIELPTVERVHEGRGSHIEPACDTLASLTNQLAWKAAVTIADTGQPVRLWTDDTGYRYAIGLPRPDGSCGSCGPFTFDTAWAYLTGVEAGIRSREEGQARDPVHP